MAQIVKYFILVVALIILRCNVYSQIKLRLNKLKVPYYKENYHDTICFFYYDSLNYKSKIYQECFTKSGIKLNEKYFVNDYENGCSSYWYRNGKMKKMESFIFGFRVGNYYEWYDNGNLKVTGCYYLNTTDSLIKMNTIKSSISKENDDGYIITIITSDNEELKDGIWKFYNILGNLTRVEVWKKGVLISR